MTKLAVIFRKDTKVNHAIYNEAEIVAVFPTELDRVKDMGCYAHIGQHGTCSVEWYHTTKPAKPEEYASLLTELQGVYADTELVVYKRRQRSYAK